jgi:hypothetical protein
MSSDRPRRSKINLWRVTVMGLISLLPGCAFNLSPFSSESPPFATALAAMPPSLRPDDIAGRWGLAAYHRDQDRVRTEAAARDQCAQPYVVDRSPSGNVLMLGHDNPQPQEMILKGSVEGKTYIGCDLSVSIKIHQPRHTHRRERGSRDGILPDRVRSSHAPHAGKRRWFRNRRGKGWRAHSFQRGGQ